MCYTFPEVRILKVAGIICEYNPFHLGHKFHIEETRRITGADYVVAIMSGNFVQRGDIAIYDKLSRAKTACQNGADLVIELPAIYSLAGAEIFASKAVEILIGLNCIDYLSFGAETDDVAELERVAEIILSEDEDYKGKLSQALGQGLSFASAREIAVGSDLLKTPNNILAVEYIKAIKKLGASFCPVAVKRSVNHDSDEVSGKFTSASNIRAEIKMGHFDLVKKYVPQGFDFSQKAHFIEDLEKSIISSLLLKTPEELRLISDVSEGLENRILKCAKECSGFMELCDAVKSKRYAHSRIRRILLHSYLGITAEMQKEAPSYIRILDFNSNGQELLNKIKQATDLPLVKNTSDVNRLKNPVIKNQWDRELLFDKIFNLF